MARVAIPSLVVLALLIGGMSIRLAHTQRQAEQAVEERYASSATLASRFIASYVSDIQERETAYATAFLADPHVTPARFALVSRAFGFDAAVLLDENGRVLNVLPASPGLVGTRLDQRYAHLRQSVAGSKAVSGVVASAALSVPIVAVAVPFPTTSGRRVFSGGASISQSPLRSFLSDVLSYKVSRAYLVDGNGTILVAGRSGGGKLAAPPHIAPGTGTVTIDGDRFSYISIPVAGTSWRLLTAASTEELFAPLSGPTHWVPWIVLAAFALACAVGIALLAKIVRSRALLEHLASHDPLTAAFNRSAFKRAFHRLAAEASRSGTSVGVLAIDIDRFKEVNDLYGHAAGDELLRRIAETLQATVRPGDVVARIGGDEFAVLLAEATERQAHEIATRIVRTLDESVFSLLDAVSVHASCSIGIALATDDDAMDHVLKRADGALYRAKATGRNTWRTALALS